MVCCHLVRNVIVVVIFAVVTIQPLVFTSLVVLTRRVFVSTARDGDDTTTTTIGSRFLEVTAFATKTSR